MDKPRLAVLNTQPPHLYFGGVERRIMETAKRLQKEMAIAIYSGTKAGFKSQSNTNGATIVPVNSTDKIYPLDNWSFSRNLNKQSIEADIYEAHAVSGYSFLKKMRRHQPQKPFIHTVHGVLADEYQQAKTSGYTSLRGRAANILMGYLARLEREMAQQATTIVTISNYSLGKLKEHYNIDEGKVRIVPNGVDTEIFRPTSDTVETKRQFGLGDEPVMLFVGSLIPRKGVGFLVETAKKVVNQQADAKFVIVGKGPLRGMLDEAICRSGLDSNFVFLGNIAETQLPMVYGMADVFVLPSVQEGQGIVLLEAQACGKPVVAFNVGGVNEAVEDKKTGLLVERGDITGLADALCSILTDEELKVKMGWNGRKFVESNFTWDICADKMLNVYSEMLKPM